MRNFHHESGENCNISVQVCNTKKMPYSVEAFHHVRFWKVKIWNLISRLYPRNIFVLIGYIQMRSKNCFLCQFDVKITFIWTNIVLNKCLTQPLSEYCKNMFLDYVYSIVLRYLTQQCLFGCFKQMSWYSLCLNLNRLSHDVYPNVMRNWGIRVADRYKASNY